MSENWSLGFTARYDTNRPVHLQKMAKSLKFRNKEDEELYYLCSENKGADLRLCFCIGKSLVFSSSGSC